MPIYGYRCTHCGHELEVLQSMRDAPLTVCDACGGRLQKKLYPVGVQFKGSGFYSTDYKRSTQKDTPDGKSEPKQDGKTEAASSSSSGGGKADNSGSGDKASSKAKAAES